MDAFEKWADGQWFRGKGDDAPAPSMMLIAKSYEDEARKAFRAGMRAAALIVADHSPDTNPGSPCNAAVAAVLAEADK